MVKNYRDSIMESFEEYVKTQLERIIESYDLLAELPDKPGSLDVIKKQTLKISGVLRVLNTKIDKVGRNIDAFVEFSKSSKSYLKNYDFEREINTMADLYSEDVFRLKNIRLKILESLNDKKLMEKIQNLIQAVK